MPQPMIPSHYKKAQTDATKRWRAAAIDFAEGLRRWQLWWLLGLNDIRQRYRRSRLGQFWITLSMATFVGTLAFVFGNIFRVDLKLYLPYLTVNIVLWSFVSSVLTESCTVFVQAEGYIRQEKLPKTLFVMRLFVRNILAMGHNSIMILVIYVVFGVPTLAPMVLVLPGLAILLINLFFASLFIGMICTRFRDLPQVVANLLQMAFFITPIVWFPSQIPDRFHFILDWNPFASHLALIARPLLGQVPSFSQYLICLITMLGLATLAIPFFARYRNRVVYWL